MLATARNAAASWKEEEYSDGKWEVGEFQHLVFHLKDKTKTMWKNTNFLVAKQEGVKDWERNWITIQNYFYFLGLQTKNKKKTPTSL